MLHLHVHLHDHLLVHHLDPLGEDPSLLAALVGISAVGGASLDLYKTERNIVITWGAILRDREMFYRMPLFTFCIFLNDDAFMFSESLTEKYCRDRLRIRGLTRQMFQRSTPVTRIKRIQSPAAGRISHPPSRSAPCFPSTPGRWSRVLCFLLLCICKQCHPHMDAWTLPALQNKNN